MATTGWAGAAALTTALAALGGPFGMLAGLGVLGVLGLISHAIAEFGFEQVMTAVKKEQLKTKSLSQIIKEIEGYPLTKGLKLKIIDAIKKVS